MGILALLLAAVCILSSGASSLSNVQTQYRSYDVKRKLQLQHQVVEYFEHAYQSYMKHAFPQDELKPLSCRGTNDFGGYSLTLIDSLDTLALMGFLDEFWKQVEYVCTSVRFDANLHVSVFETTIRVVGGLLTAHALALQMASDVRRQRSAAAANISSSPWMVNAENYDGGLLRKAVDIADRLIAAFDTPTGIPFNEVHLCNGLDRSKGHVTCPAAAGTLLLEFGTLAAWTNNCTYLIVAKRALEGIWKHRGRNNLIGTMIDILTGVWTQSEAHIGASIDSFYEYLLKSYILFGEEQYYDMWMSGHRAIHKYTFHDGWYLSSTVDSTSGGVVGEVHDYKFNSLQAFWPGLMVLGGDIPAALDAYGKMYCVVRDWGMIPEYVHLGTYIRRQSPQKIGPGYPLRPEFIESTYLLYEATHDDHFLHVAEEMLHTLGTMKQKCGFAAVLDVHTKTFEDKMDSYLLAETLKYLYLIFDPTDYEIEQERARWRDVNGIRSRLPIHLRFKWELSNATYLGQRRGWNSIFNTEAHPIVVSQETQGIFKKCASHDETLFMSHNDISKVRSSFQVFPPQEYETLFRKQEAQSDADNKQGEDGGAPPAHDNSADAAVCPVLDFMRDIAPSIQRIFHHAHTNRDWCYAHIDAKTLGHPQFTTQRTSLQVMHQMNAAALDQSNRGRLFQQLGGSNGNGIGAEHVQAKMTELSFTVPKDAAVSWSKDLSLVLTMTVVGTRKDPRVSVDAHGIVELSNFLDGVESLYMPHHNVVVFPSFGNHSSSSSSEHADSVHRAERLLANASAPRFMTSGAEFNPPTGCSRTHASEDVLMWDQLELLTLSGDGCGAIGSSERETLSWIRRLQALEKEKRKSSEESIRRLVSQRKAQRSFRGEANDKDHAEKTQGVTSYTPFGLIIPRGNCPFRTKVRYAEALGAAVTIIANQEDFLVLMADSTPDGSIPPHPEPSQIAAYMMTSSDIRQYLERPHIIEEGDAAQEKSFISQLRRRPQFDPMKRYYPVSFLCAASAKSQFKALGIDAKSSMGRDGDPSLLLFQNRLAPLVELREEETIVSKVIMSGEVGRAELVASLAVPQTHFSCDTATQPRGRGALCSDGQLTIAFASDRFARECWLTYSSGAHQSRHRIVITSPRPNPLFHPRPDDDDDIVAYVEWKYAHDDESVTSLSSSSCGERDHQRLPSCDVAAVFADAERSWWLKTAPWLASADQPTRTLLWQSASISRIRRIMDPSSRQRIAIFESEQVASETCDARPAHSSLLISEGTNATIAVDGGLVVELQVHHLHHPPSMSKEAWSQWIDQYWSTTKMLLEWIIKSDADDDDNEVPPPPVIAFLHTRIAESAFAEVVVFSSRKARNDLRQAEDDNHVIWSKKPFSTGRLLEERRRLFVNPSTSWEAEL